MFYINDRRGAVVSRFKISQNWFTGNHEWQLLKMKTFQEIDLVSLMLENIHTLELNEYTYIFEALYTKRYTL